MPHLSMEYSGNLDGRVDFQALTAVIHKNMLATGVFELGAVRVRAFKAEAWAVGDLLEQNAFIDMSLRMGAGRSGADKKRAGEAIFEAAAGFLQDLLSEPYFALSLEIREIDPALSWKRNAMHGRLRDA